MGTFAIITTFPPRRCGIANYSSDLAGALRSMGHKLSIAAVTDSLAEPCSAQATWKLTVDDRPGLYRRLGSEISSAVSLMIIQHEYGLYGGRYGSHILELMASAEVPVILTLHTIIPPPDEEFVNLTREMFSHASAVVVHTCEAMVELGKYYGPVRAPIRVIPHGTHYRPSDEACRSRARRQLGVRNFPLLVTGGFVTPNKGIEYALDAVADLKSNFPNLLYVVVGEPHPADSAGERYLHSIRTLSRLCGESVRFVTRYVSDPEMNCWLTAADICLLPYIEPTQASSGVLARCLGLGSAVVATDFPHARTIMSSMAGALVPMRDSNALAHSVRYMMSYGFLGKSRKHAIEISKSMAWDIVADQYASLITAVSSK